MTIIKRITRSALAAALTVLTLSACSNDDNTSKQTDIFYRYVTVENNLYGAGLKIHLTGEKLPISNFRTADDLKRFGVKEGDLALARITLEISAESYGYTLEELHKVRTTSIDKTIMPTDSDTYFYFDKIYLGAITYPSVWVADHNLFLNVYHFAKSEEKSADCKFYLFPTFVSGDTLNLCIRSENPDTTLTEAYARLGVYDLRTLRDQNGPAEYEARRDSLMGILDGLNKETIHLRIHTAGTLSIFDLDRWRKVGGSSEVIEVPFKF